MKNKKFLKVKDIKLGTKVIVYGDYRVKASHVAQLYGFSGYPHLILINSGKERDEKLRGLDLTKCLELGIDKIYPKPGKILS